jgi:hypothetical protein
MKIKIKKVVETVVEIGNLSGQFDHYFQDTIDYILGLEFVATSCSHDDIKSFFCYSQGGSNQSKVTMIELVDTHYSKLTFKIHWASSSTYLIVKIPK